MWYPTVHNLQHNMSSLIMQTIAGEFRVIYAPFVPIDIKWLMFKRTYFSNYERSETFILKALALPHDLKQVHQSVHNFFRLGEGDNLWYSMVHNLQLNTSSLKCKPLQGSLNVDLLVRRYIMYSARCTCTHIWNTVG